MVQIRVTTHPGEILREEFLHPLGLSARALAAAIDVPPNRVTGILNERRSVTADTAIRLGRFFGTSSQFWLNLQQSHDLSKAERNGDFTNVRPRESADVIADRRRRAIDDMAGRGWDGDLDAMRTDRG